MEGQEWRNFSNDKGSNSTDRNRVGGPTNSLLDDQGLTTTIEKGAGGANLAKLHSSMTASRQQQALFEGFEHVQNISSSLGIGESISYRAKEIYKAIVELPEFKTRERIVVASTAVFFACRQSSVDRTIKEVCKHSGADSKQVGRMIGKVKLAPTIRPLLQRTKGQGMSAAHPSQLMNRFCGQLTLDELFKTEASEVAMRLEKLGLLDGRNPATRAAVCIYILSESKDPSSRRSEKDICTVANISEGTLRKAYKDIQSHIKELLTKTEETKDQL
jgi:transcription initiation factor TFIIB